jgi:hypothetical protein
VIVNYRFLIDNYLIQSIIHQDEDKEEMKEILEMKRIHERLRNKRKVEKERRDKEAQAARDKILNM